MLVAGTGLAVSGARASFVWSCLIACVLAPRPTQGQAHFFLRLAPSVSLVTVEHTKEVTIGGGSSSSTSSSSVLAAAAILSSGFRSSPSAGWTVGGELEVIAPMRRRVEGTIHPTPHGNPHDVWPGRWEFSDRFGVGGNLLVGRSLGDGGARAYVLVGVRRSRSEFATGGTNPETGIAGEDRTRLLHWPAVAGIGTTLMARWPVDVRLRYFRSTVDWVISQPDLGLDYGYVVSGFSLSVGTRVTQP